MSAPAIAIGHDCADYAVDNPPDACGRVIGTRCAICRPLSIAARSPMHSEHRPRPQGHLVRFLQQPARRSIAGAARHLDFRTVLEPSQRRAAADRAQTIRDEARAARTSEREATRARRELAAPPTPSAPPTTVAPAPVKMRPCLGCGAPTPVRRGRPRKDCEACE